MKDDKQRFKEYIQRFQTAMFVTQHDGHIRSRPMAIARTDDDGTMWFLSPIATAKVDDLLEDAHAAITVQNATTFASVSGTCRVLRDDVTVKRLRSAAVEPWLDDGARDAVAIEFTPTEAEFWSRDDRGLRFMFEAARAAIAGRTVKPTRVDAHSYINLSGGAPVL